MESYFEKRVNKLYQQVNKLIDSAEMYKAKRNGEKFQPEITKEFKEDFFKLVDKVILSLMEDKDNFYGYFLFQMGREIRFDITSASGVNFKGAKYVIYFNPILFLQLNMKQMETTIKHEIHHVLSLHLSRAKELKNKYSTLTVNLAMDIVVNQYLDNLPPYSTTLKGVNLKYNLNMEAYNTLEYYAEKIQSELDLMEENDEGEEDDSHLGDFIQDDDSPAPQDSAAYTMLREQLEEVMNTLTPREAKVLKLRFGLEDGKARTLEEVGKEFDVTRERIRQIEAKALRKLRHPSRSKKLRDYME